MNARQLLVALIFADFAVFSAFVVSAHPPSTWYALATETWFALQVSLDLVLSLSVAAVLMVWDARREGINPVPYLLLTLTGSFGPLAYLIRRLAAPSPAPAPAK